MALACLALLLLSYILIQIPLVSIVAILMLAPWWFGGALQLSMGGILFLAATREIGRAWLALPVFFWAACAGLSFASVQRAHQQAAAVEAANAAVAWRAPRPFVYRAVDHGSVGYSEIVERFRDTSAIFPGEKDTTLRYYAKGAECDQASKGFYYDRRFDEAFLYRGDIFPSYRGADKTRQCILSRDVRGRGQASFAVVNELSPVQGDWLNPRSGERFTVLDDSRGKVLAQVETATIRAIPPILLLEVGCRSGGIVSPASGCGIRPGYMPHGIPAGYKPRTDKGNPFIPTTDPMNSRVGALGKAIGLKPRLPND